MKVLVFGGSGFVGSAVCSSAVARGWQVVSCTRRGEPFKTPSGATPAWVHQVSCERALSLTPELMCASNAGGMAQGERV